MKPKVYKIDYIEDGKIYSKINDEIVGWHVVSIDDISIKDRDKIKIGAVYYEYECVRDTEEGQREHVYYIKFEDNKIKYKKQDDSIIYNRTASTGEVESDG